MRITLISPHRWESGTPNLGVLYIASVLEKEGHQVQVLDPQIDNYAVDPDLIKDIKGFSPDILGFSFLTPDYHVTSELINRLKPELPDTLFCCGGVHTTALPKETLQDLDVDFVVVGEGEITMKEVCERLDFSKDLTGIKGVMFKQSGVVISNPPRELINDLDSIPLPARHLLDFEKYLTPPGKLRGLFMNRCTNVIAGRGCPYNCIFCASKIMFGRKVRHRSVSNVIAEIKHLIEKYNIDGLSFPDDAFTIDKKWTIGFCKQLKENKISIKWGCQARVNTVSAELLLLMKDAGCVQVEFGVESGSVKVLKALKKGITPEMTRKAFKMCRDIGIRPLANFMLGNPDETLEDLQKTFDLAKEIEASYTTFFFTTPFPGTELFQMAKDKNWVNLDLIKNYERYEIRRIDEPFMEINFSKEELSVIRSKFQNYFFIRNNRIYFLNPVYTLKIVRILIHHPLQFVAGLLRALKAKNVDEIGGVVFKILKQDQMKKKKS